MDDPTRKVCSDLDWWKLSGAIGNGHTTYPQGLFADEGGRALAEMCEDFSRQHDNDLNPPGSRGDHVEFFQSMWSLRGWWDAYWRWPRRQEQLGILTISALTVRLVSGNPSSEPVVSVQPHSTSAFQEAPNGE